MCNVFIILCEKKTSFIGKQKLNYIKAVKRYAQKVITDSEKEGVKVELETIFLTC